jgi:hypothetical protein
VIPNATTLIKVNFFQENVKGEAFIFVGYTSGNPSLWLPYGYLNSPVYKQYRKTIQCVYNQYRLVPSLGRDDKQWDINGAKEQNMFGRTTPINAIQ